MLLQFLVPHPQRCASALHEYQIIAHTKQKNHLLQRVSVELLTHALLAFERWASPSTLYLQMFFTNPASHGPDSGEQNERNPGMCNNKHETLLA